jgi:hypothetical protein
MGPPPVARSEAPDDDDVPRLAALGEDEATPLPRATLPPRGTPPPRGRLPPVPPPPPSEEKETDEALSLIRGNSEDD